ncbi:MAG: AMP-binding protein [Akkermansiaceae bacterium]|nr:AMP-binding protein [Akkermansiaceae bacterium]MDP4996396.1 AMP-binding protein [Akkermansiaceae bacterium]
MLSDLKQFTHESFWEDPGCFVAGEWEGELPDVSVPGACVLFRTSGSTGEGKWVVLRKSALLVSARAVNEWLGVDERSVWGLALPLNHVGGFGIVARAYAAGSGLAVFPEKWDAGAFSEWIPRDGVSHTSLVPTQVHDLVKRAILAPASLKAVVVGGGRLEESLGEAARELGWPVLASYGMTEACSQIATQRLSSLGKRFGEAGMELLPIWEAEVNEDGLLSISGDALFSGTITKEGFSQRQHGAFLTSDRVRLDGCILIPEGRADSLIKVMGELVDIEAVEREFLRIAGDRIDPGEFAVVALPDERRGHVLVAVFEGGLDAAVPAYREYQENAGGLLRFERWIEMEAFPKTNLGKLRRAQLAEICSKIFQPRGRL